MVALRQQLLVAPEQTEAWAKSQTVPYNVVAFGPLTNEEGVSVSEWSIPLDDIRAFIARNDTDWRRRT
jgi:hypothetical protein